MIIIVYLITYVIICRLNLISNILALMLIGHLIKCPFIFIIALLSMNIYAESFNGQFILLIFIIFNVSTICSLFMSMFNHINNGLHEIRYVKAFLIHLWQNLSIF